MVGPETQAKRRRAEGFERGGRTCWSSSGTPEGEEGGEGGDRSQGGHGMSPVIIATIKQF